MDHMSKRPARGQPRGCAEVLMMLAAGWIVWLLLGAQVGSEAIR